MINSPTVLVTGGAGYIGSHICKSLKKNGFEPIVLDDLSQGHLWAVKWGPIIQGDIGDQNLIRKLVKKFQPISIIHLSAFSNLRESLSKPFFYYHNNVTKLAYLLHALDGKVPYFVFSSSCAIYGLPSTIPISETHPMQPIHPYGHTKWMGEQMIQQTAKETGMYFAFLRYFNAAGADPDGETGELHVPETHLIPLLIQASLQKKSHFTLHGEDHNTPDGTPIRDFIHVTDLADAHVKALNWMRKNHDNLKLNLGTGKGYSIREVLQQIENLYQKKIQIIKGKRCQEDPPVLIADARKAKKVLDWTPQFSDLPIIIETAWKWQEKMANKQKIQ